MRAPFASGSAIILLGMLLLPIAAPQTVMGERELAYDSGTPGASVSLPYLPHLWVGGGEEVNEQYQWIGNSMLSVRFTPDNSTLEMLSGVRFYITGDFTSFRVWLFDANRIFLTYGRGSAPASGSQVVSRVYSWTVTPNSTGWVYLNVTDPAYPIIVTDDFYVAIEFTTAERPTLGVDIIGANSGRGWVVQNETANGWVPYSTYAKQNALPDGNLMIRATVSPIYLFTNETATSAAESPQFPLTTMFFAGAVLVLAASAVGVWQLRKRVHSK